MYHIPYDNIAAIIDLISNLEMVILNIGLQWVALASSKTIWKTDVVFYAWCPFYWQV